MDVGVDEARHYHLAAIIPHPYLGWNAITALLPLAEPIDAAVADDQQAVFDEAGIGLYLLGLAHHPGDVKEAAAHRLDGVVVFISQFPLVVR